MSFRAEAAVAKNPGSFLPVSERDRDCYSFHRSSSGSFFPDDLTCDSFRNRIHPDYRRGAGSGLIFIGVLIQWSLRKALPSRPPQVEAAPEVESAPEVELPPPKSSRPNRRPKSSSLRRPSLFSLSRRLRPVREPVRIGLGLRKTRENFLARIRAALTGSAKIDDIYEGLEEALIAADVGVEASMKISAAVRAKLGNDNRPDAIRDALKAEIATIMMSADRAPADSGDAPLVIMLVGVNGVGKTTTVAKLAARLKAERGSVIVAAADTFRAAAIEQLEVWCDRAGADIIKQSQGSDPAAVAFDAVKAAVARKTSTVSDRHGRASADQS